MIRWIWIIWVTICCFNFCTQQEVQKVYGAEAEAAEIKFRTEYTVQSGDTLGTIADKIGITWQELWKLNPQIEDPNLIYPGQVLQIRWIRKFEPPMSKREKLDRLTRLMFKKAGLVYMPRIEIMGTIDSFQNGLDDYNLEDMATQRQILHRYITYTRAYEIHLLSEAIVEQCNNDSEFYSLSGLAWQETHFVNVRGKHDERGFYQVLPSTIKEFYKLDDIATIILLDEIENDPAKATAVALEMLRKYKWNWRLWNHGIEYEWHLNNKIYAVKQEFVRR